MEEVIIKNAIKVIRGLIEGRIEKEEAYKELVYLMVRYGEEKGKKP